MSWTTRIEHTPAGLALTFGAPLSRLVPLARPASSKARLVIDLLPGGVARPMIGPSTGTMVIVLLVMRLRLAWRK